MKLAKELIVTTLFLALYLPLSLAIWYAQGKTASLLIVMLIGLVIIDSYLAVQVIRTELKRHSRRRYRTTVRITEPRRKVAEEPDDYVGFRTLFSDNLHGGGVL
jgi:hypothetical protein